jgi:DNA-binding NarL/FixJ family response regulator
MISVIVVDDHHLVRQGIRSLLEKAPDMRVVGEAADGVEAVKLAQQLKPDVVVMDILMPNMNGTQAAERMRSLIPAPRVILLTMYSDTTLVHQALRYGVRGYLLKRSVVEELLLAVRAAAHGDLYLSPAISSSLVESNMKFEGSLNSSLAGLSPREIEVLELIAQGHTSASIGQVLGISEKTVEKHRSSLMEKSGIHDVAGLVRFAIKHNLVSLDV